MNGADDRQLVTCPRSELVHAFRCEKDAVFRTELAMD